MKVSISSSVIGGTVSAPPSKSYTHRAIVLAGLARGKSTIHNPLLGEDTLATLRAMKMLGTMARQEGDELIIRGGRIRPPSGEIDCANSGTTLRLLAGVVSLLSAKVTLTGDSSLQQRPMRPLLNALTELGVTAKSSRGDGTAPFTIQGPNQGRWAHIKGDVSSQFISSLLICSALKELDTDIIITTPLKSRPYVELTRNMMSRFGGQSWETKNGYRVPGGQVYRPCNFTIPGDFSSAAFPLVAGALAGKATVTGLDPEDPQADRKIVDILKAFGAAVQWSGDAVTAERGELVGGDIDMGDCPDLFPITAVLATQARGTSRLSNAQHLRHKESDRIRATVNFLRAMGAEIEEAEDGCIVQGPVQLKGHKVDTMGDHRILMAATVAGLVAEGNTTLSEGESNAVSYPAFFADLRTLGAKIEGVK